MSCPWMWVLRAAFICGCRWLAVALVLGGGGAGRSAWVGAAWPPAWCSALLRAPLLQAASLMSVRGRTTCLSCQGNGRQACPVCHVSLRAVLGVLLLGVLGMGCWACWPSSGVPDLVGRCLSPPAAPTPSTFLLLQGAGVLAGASSPKRMNQIRHAASRMKVLVGLEVGAGEGGGGAAADCGG